MKKYITLGTFVWFLMAPAFVYAACSGSGASWTSTPDYASVSSCISQVDRNGTVTVTAGDGTETWTTTLAITKGVTLVGPGASSLEITTTQTYLMTYIPDATVRTNGETFEVSGFTFTNGTTHIYIDGPNSGALITKVKIHDNTFKHSSSRSLYWEDHIVGVVYNNTFTNCEYIWGVYGANSQTWVDLKESAQKYGMDAGQTSVYFEDNTINWTENYGAGRTTNGQGAPGIVMRYNSWNYTNHTDRSDPHDFHGLQIMTTAAGFTCPNGCGYSTCTPTQDGSCDETIVSAEEWAFLKSETYGNILTNSTNAATWADFRGSWNLFFNNRISGTSNPSLDVSDRACDEAQKPALGYHQEVNNTYAWNNWVNSTRKDLAVSYDWCGSGSVGKPHTSTANVDWWNFNVNTLNGSTQKGINCGSAAPSSSCSTGDGYWQTTHSPCSTPPTTLADMRTYTQAGTLYKCTSPNTWTSYYQPYTYPHPLRGESDTTTPTLSGCSFSGVSNGGTP